MALRAIFFIISILLGLAIGAGAGTRGEATLLLGSLIGAFLSATLLMVERALQNVPVSITVNAGIGFSVGVLLAGVLILASSHVFPQPSLVSQFGTLVALVVLPYLGLVVGARSSQDQEWTQVFDHIAPKSKQGNIPIPKLLDTSVIIDGRIADLCETGFIEGRFIIPQFILQELQHISDSADSLKRARGRRGLDILNHIQKNADIEVAITEEDFPHVKEVDAKLVELAKKIQARIITNDLNLNKVAELQGVRVLNINDLSNAIKPVVLPGETIRVFVLKEGKEAGQGVAYLDDGTMVVVDNAKRCIGKNVDVVVTSVLQTSAGRMIFTRLKEESDRDELSFARG